MKRSLGIGVVLGLTALGMSAACSSDSGGGGTGGAAGGGNFGGFGATGATGAVGGTGATGAVGGTGATGAVGGTGATGAVGGTGATGGGTTVTLPAGCADGVPTACNPVSNEGCAGTGVACDFSDPQSSGVLFECYPPPNDTPKGGVCGVDSNGPWCQPTFGCDTPNTTPADGGPPADGGGADAGSNPGKCAKYCCSATDCESGETCVPFDGAQIGTLGFCT